MSPSNTGTGRVKQDFGSDTNETHPTTPCADGPVARSSAQAAFTPGPWDYWQDPIEGLFRIRHGIDGGLNRTIVGAVLKETNARLIAAAPDLLAALQKLKWISVEKDNMEFACRTTCFVLDEINAAISRALGTEHDGKGEK